MKKILIAAFCLVGLQSVSQAGLFDGIEDRISTAKFSIEVATAAAGSVGTSTNVVLVDLSDTTNWPHKNTREINISSLRLAIEGISTSTGIVKVGVVTAVNASSGTVTWFSTLYNAEKVPFVLSNGSYIKTRVEGGTAFLGTSATSGTTPYLISNDKLSPSTIYQTDIVLPSTNGNTAPGRGDIVAVITNRDGINSITVNIEVQYYTPETR